MASIKNLKKDINYVLGDVIDYTLEVASQKNASEQGDKIVDEAIQTFDNLIAKVNEKNIENRKQHFKAINVALETEAEALLKKANSL